MEIRALTQPAVAVITARIIREALQTEQEVVAHTVAEP